MFKDRLEAGKLLAKKLKSYKKGPGVVLAVPRGGVPVAYEIAKELDLPLQLIFTKKIGHPENKEYAIGAASMNDHFIVPHIGVSDSYIKAELKRIRKNIKKMQNRLDTGKKEDLKNKTVILVDDGIATGHTLLATIKVLQKARPKEIVVAAPVSTKDAYNKLASEADKIIVILIPKKFRGVGGYYYDFSQVTEEEVQFFLDRLRRIKKAS
jgi:predicted phosphoribosyltransferase